AWKLAYGRTPSGKERDLATAFLSGPTTLAPTFAVQDSGHSTADFKPRSIDEKPLVKAMPQLGSQAIYIRNARPDDMLRLPAPIRMPTEDLTVEAYVLLDSIYDDASVRVIASQWDGKNDHAGWSLGVTSAK